MRLILGVLTLVIGLGSCVPAKKYNDLLAKEQNCSEELKKYKTSSLDYEAQLKTVQTRANLMQKDITQLKSDTRSEEHTSELQSRPHLVCRLLLEKKKKN